MRCSSNERLQTADTSDQRPTVRRQRAVRRQRNNNSVAAARLCCSTPHHTLSPPRAAQPVHHAGVAQEPRQRRCHANPLASANHRWCCSCGVRAGSSPGSGQHRRCRFLRLPRRRALSLLLRPDLVQAHQLLRRVHPAASNGPSRVRASACGGKQHVLGDLPLPGAATRPWCASATIPTLILYPASITCANNNPRRTQQAPQAHTRTPCGGGALFPQPVSVAAWLHSSLFLALFCSRSSALCRRLSGMSMNFGRKSAL